MGTSKQSEEEGARSFCRTLEQIDDGQGVIDMSVELQVLLTNLLKHARNTNQDAKGSYTLKLQFNVEPNSIVNVGYEVGVKTPKRKTGKTTVWVTNGGNLVAENPRQQKLPLREVQTRHYADVDNDVALPMKEV